MTDVPLEGDPQDLLEQAGIDPSQGVAAEGASNPNDLPDNLIDALTGLIDKWEVQEDEAREPKLREWKLLENYWNDNQYNIWSEISQDWRPIEEFRGQDDLDLEGFEPRTVNIYKAHGESVIAALSAGIPGTRFFPDDANSVDDIATSKVYSRAAELLQRRNKAPLLLIKSLYILWNQGVVASYNFARTDPSLGTILQPIQGQVSQDVTEHYCPSCGADMVGQASPGGMGIDGAPPEAQGGIGGSPGMVGGMPPGGPTVPSPDEEESPQSKANTADPTNSNPPGDTIGQSVCPECGYEGQPEQDVSTQMVPGIIGHEEITRINEQIQVFSPLYFRVPHWITSQEESPYLGLDTEQSKGSVIRAFREDAEIRDKIEVNKDTAKYGRWARTPVDKSYFETDLVTLRQRWIRNWGLEEIEQEAEREELKKRFPEGVYVIYAGDRFIAARGESLDDHWTISISPTATHVHAQPLGQSIKSGQDITNELVTATVDNIEHQMSMTFVDTTLLNLQTFKDSRTAPGMMYPVTVPPGQQIGNYIHETKPSTLSDEVRFFMQEMKEFNQFTSGAFPSVYGGVMQGGSGTAKEYEMSRAQALQRLQILWRILNEWWSEMMGKAVKDFLNNLTYDEKFVKPHGKMGYINVWIRKSEATGKVGEVIPETSEQMPVSWAQKRDILLNAIQMKDENLNAAIFHPENTAIVGQTLGFAEFYIPGDDDRSKQLNEIIQLLTAPPALVPMMGPMGPIMKMQSTVPVEPKIDDHAIHMGTIKSFCVSDVGQQMKTENPEGYANIQAHYDEHEQAEMQVAMENMQKQMLMGGGPPPGQETPADNPKVEAPQNG
jgi:predicted RNA-binding Zn-ribbon protein involved in translation (DUF1610 family)